MSYSATNEADFLIAFKGEAVDPLFVNNPLPMWVYDAHTLDFLEVNNAAIEQYGYSRGEFAQMTILDIRPKEDIKRVLSSALCSRPELQHSGYWRHTKKDGTLFDVEIVSHTINYRGLNAVLVVAKDVTERHNLERELLETNAKYESLVHSVNGVVWECELPSLRFTFVSNQCERIVGYAQTDWLTRLTWKDLIHPDDFISVVKFCAKETQAKRDHTIDYRIVRSDGNVIWVRDVTTVIVENDVPVKLLGVLLDITEEKRIETAIAETERRFKNIFEHSLDVIYVSTVDGRFLEMNPAGIKLFGYDSKEEVLNMDIRQDLYVNPADRDQFLGALQQQGFVKNFHCQMKKKNGEPIDVLLTAHAEYNSNNEFVETQGFIRDVTNQKKLEEQLLHTQRMEEIGRLAGGVAHDFNNILGIIMGYTTMSPRSWQDASNVPSFLAAMTKAAKRGAGLVKQLLTFARQTNVELQPLHIKDEIKELVKLFEETFPKLITFTTTIEEELPFIKADRTQFSQCMLNICVNARDAMPDGGTLTIEAKRIAGSDVRKHHPEAKEQEYVLVSMSDTGIGMSEAIRARIFDPFFTTKDFGKGTGLGLSVVYGLMKAHEGFISVESEIGKGTTFQLYFPACHGCYEHETVPKETELPRGTETILVIEDEEMLREMSAATLSIAGYTVYTAADGVDGLQKFMEHQDEIALVMSDLGLPKLSGLDVARNIKQRRPNVSVIIGSGHFVDGSLKELRSLGITDTLAKPVDMGTLLRKVREVLDRESAKDEV